MNVTIENAAVFRGGGRRWFTLRAACKAEARALLNKHCECDYCDHEMWGAKSFLAACITQIATHESLSASLTASCAATERSK